MKILAIETSCDDTGIAILEVESEKFKVLANVVSSQAIHQNYGGVFPMMAKREHQANLVPTLMRALTLAKLANPKSETLNPKQIQNLKKIFEKENTLFERTIEFLQTHEKPDVDYIAVTHGPGLEPCLWVGINFARVLSYMWDIPLIPVNHIEAHILVNFLDSRFQILDSSIFPAISLVVSGGHTQLIFIEGVGKYKIIGETRDDAAGECFDKCAKLLGLGYPGGPIISKLAADARRLSADRRRASAAVPKFPRPMINSKDYDFSFSGLKTAVLHEVTGKALTPEYVKNVAAGAQEAIIDVLLKKTFQAAKDFGAKSIILGGGVSANQELRRQLKERIKLEIPNTLYFIPDIALSTDNGLMIAVAAYFNMKNPPSHKAPAGQRKTVSWENLEADANLRVGS